MAIKEEILNRVKEIPPLSTSASQLMMLMGKPDRDLQETVKIVECDLGLTAKVLRVVNSSAFALMQPTTSIARAVSYLGEKMVLGIALDACTGSILRRPMKGYEGRSDALWEHNLMTAIAARRVAGFAKEEISSDIAFTAGILHDIGKAGPVVETGRPSSRDHPVPPYSRPGARGGPGPRIRRASGRYHRHDGRDGHRE